ncbi:hypothetical protein CGCA056_v006905 [Colletotrichum aenigma]|uniref:uncharacterized protein n=1 Tax=Colletotrichum aenigma TaxID=1215731 RepID=UPI0018726518|nr:uncharacterized protein CGCA056_v006905 [Colletotrichum aenigma]KAF5522173.1 hypothetical protein CGCA056_v006905 [Colletotrichum aenigma]
MSAPPHLIHIKRKRGDEDAPVTYLQLESAKRHQSGSSWVYRRRIAPAKSSSRSGAGSLHHSPTKPVIQTSKPGDELPHSSRSPAKPVSQPAPDNAAATDKPPATEAPAPAPAPATSSAAQRPANPAAEPRRFHMSRSAMSSPTGSTILKAGGVTKRGRYGTAVFVERGKKKASKRLSVALDAKHAAAISTPEFEMGDDAKPAPKKPQTKRPSAPRQDVESQRKPLPSVAPTQDMSKIAADMDQWVLHEIGLNLKSMELQNPAPPAAPAATASSPSRFKPKAPVKRFAERHPELAKELDGGKDRDESMTDASEADDDDDDYVIEVYELAPSKPLLANIPPEEIGVLRFDTKEDMELFYGNEEEDDSDYDDDEDENAENHYTADYPEDEVDSEDEYDRHAYLFRNANASDDEEFDLREQEEDEDEDMYVMEGDNRRDEDDVFQEKIRRYIRQHGSD